MREQLNLPKKDKCIIKDCPNKPKWEFRLSLAVNNSHEPAISTPLLYSCDEHKDSFTFESLTPPQNWDILCNGFTSMGKMAPKKEFSKLIIQPIK